MPPNSPSDTPNPSTSLLSRFSSEIAILVATAAPSTVSISIKDHMASGFLWRPDVVVAPSEAIDADHGSEITVETHSGPVQMKLAGRDPSTDIAILTAASPAGTSLPLATATPVHVGEAAIVAARSRHGVSCAVGFVSLAGGPWESMRGGKIEQRITLATRLEPNQEGGPVLNAGGACIGMAVLGPRRRTLVIPAATIERIAPDLLQNGRIKRGYLGVAGQPIRLQTTAALGEPKIGLLVLRLDTGGPAQHAGILQGDIITSIAGKPIGSPSHLRRSLGPDTVGHTVPCAIIRAGQPVTLDVAVTERQSR